MLGEKGRLIALYDPEMVHLSKLLDRRRGLPHPKIQMWNATKYKYVILWWEITHDSEKNNQNQQNILHLRDPTAAI